MLDWLIKNGTVIDGSGAPRFAADVAVERGRIVEVGRLEAAQAARVIDAAGKIVAPGFIDMHSHNDLTNAILPESDSFAHQGITTAVTGNCGSSLAPVSSGVREEARAMMGAAVDLLPWHACGSFSSYLDHLEKIGLSINMHPLVGQGAIRSAVMGQSARRPTEDEIERMQTLAVRAVEEGAFGISTGLIYAPGSYASMEEIIEVTRPVGERGGYYFSHVRGEADTLLKALAEEIEIGRVTGASIQHSHYKAQGKANWDLAARGLEMIDQARAEGIDITADMYPYTAGSTNLTALLPEWALEDGLEALTKRLSDPATRAKITYAMKNEGVFRVADDEWDRVLIPFSANPAHIGRYIAEMAAEAGQPPHEWIYDAILETQGQMAIINFLMSEDNVKMQMRHPAMMIGTDGWGMPFEGPFAATPVHPRSMGTYPRVLGKYAREEGVLSLEEALWKMTGFPAQKLRLKERGQIRRGYHADLVVFDPATVIDKATFEECFQRPVGIEHVLVNGAAVIADGAHTHARPGVITTR